MTKKEVPGQFSFVVEGVVVPQIQSIQDLPDGKEIAKITESRKLWHSDRTNDFSFYHDTRRGGSLKVFRMDSWQIDTPVGEDKKVNGAVIVTPTINYRTIELISQKIEDYSQKLSRNSPFFIFEEKNDETLKTEEKLTLLKNMGLHEKHFLSGVSSSFNLLESRTEKPRKGRKSVNLLDAEKHPKAYQTATRVWREMVKDYQKRHFSIVDAENSPILQRMRNSKNPPADYQLLRHGCGVRVKNEFCGCTYDIDFRGDEHSFWLCPNHNNKHED